MATPTARSPLNVYEGLDTADLNQLLGLHAPVVVYAPSGGQTPLISPTLGPSFGQMQNLDNGNQSPVWLDQPFTMNGTVLDRVQLPMSIGGGIGNDIMVGLYADSGGAASGLPLAQTLVPKQFLQPSPCADFNGVILGPWNSSSPNLVLPANLAVINSQAFTDDGVYMVGIGGWDGTTPVTTVVVAQLASAGLEAWAQSTPLPVALASAAASYVNGSIVVVGGSKSTTAAVNTVYTASYSGGIVSAWTSQAALPASLTGVATEVVTLANPSPTGVTAIVYAVGGATLAAGPTYTAKTSVYSAAIAYGGTISSWATPAGSQLPVALYNGQLVQCNGWLVYMGGVNVSMSEVSTVYGARIHPTTGAVGSWIPFPALPQVCAQFGAFVVDNNIVVVNGVGTAFAASLAMNSGGPASSWVTQPQPPTTAYSSSSTVANGTIVYPGLIVGGTTLPGITSLVQSVPSISVPLHVTGLTNTGTYHVVIAPLGLIDGVNQTQVAITTQPSTGFPGIVQGTSGTLAVAVLPASESSAVTGGWIANSDNPTITFPSHTILSTTTSTVNGYDYIVTAFPPSAVKCGPGVTITFTLTATNTSGTARSIVTQVFAYNAAGTSLGLFIGTSATDAGATVISGTGTTPAGTASLLFLIGVFSPAIGEQHTFSAISATATSGYIPLSFFTSGKTLKPVHVLDDIANTQPNEYSTVAYDYWGKPVHYGESVLPLVNLLAPNNSNFGGPVQGTTAGWTAGANTTLGVSSLSGNPVSRLPVGAGYSNSGEGVTYTSSTMTDSEAPYLQTNLYAGAIITVYGDGEFLLTPACTGVVASNTATTYTLTAAGWRDANGNVFDPTVFNADGSASYVISSNAVLSPATPGFPNINNLQGEYFMSLTRTSTTGTASANTATGTSGVPVVVGQHYTAFAWMELDAFTPTAGLTRNYTATILWYTAAGAACAHASDAGSAVAGIVYPFGGGVWVQPFVNAVAPATAAFAAVQLSVASCAANEVHDATCVSFALDNSTVSGLTTPQLAYFEPQAGPGGTRTFLQLVYDAATSQLTGVTDISTPYPTIFGTGVDVANNILATYSNSYTNQNGITYDLMTDTNAVWPMNGLVGWVVTAQSTGDGSTAISETTATILFNTGNTIILTAAGWSNGQPDNGAAYSIAPATAL